jgi:hypothetical protein
MMIHDLDISKWPDTTFAKWYALIEKTPALDWNRKVVEPAKVSARTAKLSASTLSSASAGRSKTS